MTALQNHITALCLFLFGAILYVAGINGLRAIPRLPLDERLQVVMPAYIQVVLAWGDRHLAANLGVFRAATLGANIRDSASYAVQAQIQQQASILNPRHEDNSYLAAAILPWEGQLEIAQWVLNRATESRDWDAWTPFYQGFNEYHFNKNNELAGQLATLASDRAEGKNKRFFRIVAAKWLAKTADKDLAVALLKVLRDSTTDKDIRKQLDARIVQLQGLHTLQTAMELYTLINGQPTMRLTDLLENGYLITLPKDPFNYGYRVDEQGNVVIAKPQRKVQ